MKWPTWLPRPSFWVGYGSILDLFGTQRLRIDAMPTDAEALRADGEAIKGDFATVLASFEALEHEQED